MSNNRSDRRNPLRLTTAALALAAALIGASGAWALPDLEITQLTVQSPAQKGACNTISLSVRNSGTVVSNVAAIHVFIATYQTGSPFQSRVEQEVVIGGVIQPGNVTSFTLNDLEFAAEGNMTVQALVDSKNVVQESNENNNTRVSQVSVSGNCYTPPPPPPPPAQTCDLQATFSAPGGSSLPGGQPVQFVVSFSNPLSAGPCAAAKLNLTRYSNRQCGGRGVRVGGTRAWHDLPALGPGQSAQVTFPENTAPKTGTFCYKLGYSPHAYNTKTNSHRPQKVVSYQ